MTFLEIRLGTGNGACAVINVLFGVEDSVSRAFSCLCLPYTSGATQSPDRGLVRDSATKLNTHRGSPRPCRKFQR